MYQHARRISEAKIQPDEYLDVARLQSQSYRAAINALSLVDPKNAWITLPSSEASTSNSQPDDFSATRKNTRRILCHHIPLDQFDPNHQKNVEIVDLTTMKHEYMLVTSRIRMAERHPDQLQHIASTFFHFSHVGSTDA